MKPKNLWSNKTDLKNSRGCITIAVKNKNGGATGGFGFRPSISIRLTPSQLTKLRVGGVDFSVALWRGKGSGHRDLVTSQALAIEPGEHSGFCL